MEKSNIGLNRRVELNKIKFKIEEIGPETTGGPEFLCVRMTR